MDDDRLLEELGRTLLVDPVLPDGDERAALHRALLEAPQATATVRAPRGIRVLRRPVAAGVAAVILLSGGAAAAVETDSLPAPLRSIAATLGLPVPPSPLAQAQHAVVDLSRALAAREVAATRDALTSLLAALPALSASDRAQLGPDVAELIAEAEIFLAAQPANSSSASPDPEAGARRGTGGTDDAGTSGRGSGDDSSGTDERGSTGSQASGAGATGASAATGGETQSGGDGATSGPATTGGGTDGGGLDGGGSAPTASGGTPTTVGTTNTDGGDGSSGTDGGTTNSLNTTGTDGSGSDGGTSGSDGGTSGGTPH
jgi:hypothetical protein